MNAPASVEVRILRAGDEPLLAGVAPGVFDDPLDAGAAEAFLRDPRHHLVVAVEDGVVIGFASAVEYVHPDAPRPELWINEVGVAPDRQGRGVGRRLMHVLLEHARERGCTEAWVLTDESNEAARRLYAASGGAEEPARPVMFSFPLDPGAGRP